MKYLPLLWSNLGRRKVRTTFTLLSILIAFVLFGYLAAIRQAFSMGIDLVGVDRLVMIHKVSLIQPLPYAYMARIARLPGVEAVTHATWFGGIYQNPNTWFQGIAQLPVEPEEYLDMYPEFLVPAEQKKAWLADRTGALVGRATAERYGWKVGDVVPVQATFWRQKGGGKTWTFTVRGIYDTREKGQDNTQFLWHWDYFDEARFTGQGMVGWYIIRIADPQQAPAMVRKIDGLFANSSAETKTSTEKAFMQGFAKQIGDIGAILTAILTAVFFTMLLVAGNAMAQAVRERTNELAVLKTLGYRDGQVMALVLAESTLLALLGGGLGLALAWALVAQGDPTGGALPIFFIPVRALVLGVALVVAFGLVTGFLPAYNAMRLRIVEALRRVA